MVSITYIHLQHSPVVMIQFLPTGWNLYKFLSAFFNLYKDLGPRLSSNHSQRASGGWYVAVNVSQGGFRVFMASSSSELSSCTTVGKPTCRARLQHGQLLWKTNIWRSKKICFKRDLQKFLKNASDKIMFHVFWLDVCFVQLNINLRTWHG